MNVATRNLPLQTKESWLLAVIYLRIQVPVLVSTYRYKQRKAGFSLWYIYVYKYQYWCPNNNT